MEAFIETLKKLSIPGSVLVGIGVAGLYFFGIAIYSLSKSMLGVPRFDFSLQNCLEYGGAGFVELLAGMPALIVIGIADNIATADSAVYLLIGLPLVIYLAINRLRKSDRPFLRKLCKVSVCTLLLYLILMYLVLYVVLLVSVSQTNLLLDPQVNVALENRQAILAEMDQVGNDMDFGKYGINSWDEWTANIVLRDNIWVTGKVGAMYSICGLFFLYGALCIRSCRSLQCGAEVDRYKTGRKFLYLYRTFLGIFLVFFLGFLFVVPARTLVLLELQQPKVDLVIDGMSELTSKYYLVLVGNYDKTYALYNPNAQNILIVQKDQVKALVLKNSISVFADRRDFRKTPWLGVRGDWRYAKDAKDAQGAVLGFEVNAVVPGSPAAAASIQPGDLLQRIGTVALDGTIDLRKVIERLPLKEQIPLVLTRGEQPFSLIVQLQIMP